MPSTPIAADRSAIDLAAPAALARPLVGAPARGAAGPLRHPGAAGVGAAVPGGHHLGLLVPAQRGNRARDRVAEARYRDRPAADAAAPDREPGAAGAHGQRAGEARNRRRRLRRPGAGLRARTPDRDADRLAGRQPQAQGQPLGHAVPRGKRARQRRHRPVAAARRARATPPEVAFAQARDMRQPVYSRAFVDSTGSTVFQMQVPLVARNTFAGTLLVEYSVESLLRHFVPPDIARRHSMSVVDDRQRVLAGTVTPMPGQEPTRSAPIVYDAAAGAGRQRPAAARPGLPHLDRPDQQHAVLDGRGAVGADGVDAARQLAPPAPPRADPGGAGAGDELPPRDGELHAHRHARDGPGRPHHLCQRRVLRDDRFCRSGADRPRAALPLLAAGPHRREHAACCSRS